MAMSTIQGELWKKITQLYFQWDPEGNGLMPVSELGNQLPAVPASLIQETLTHAEQSRLAEVRAQGQAQEFRPLHH